MRRKNLLRTLLLCLAALWTAAATSSAQQLELRSDPRPVATPGRVVVKLGRDLMQQGISPSMFGDLSRRLAITSIQPWINPQLVRFRVHQDDAPVGAQPPALALGRIMVVEYASNVNPVEAADEIASVAGVEYAEPMYPRRLLRSTNDPLAFQLWYLDVLHAREAWDSVSCDSSMTVAVIDAGIDRGHEDLANTIWHNAGEMGPDNAGHARESNGIDDDGNGFVDDWRGYDFAGADGRTPDNNPDPTRESHGTEMAGIIGASGDNAIGTVGIAFGVRLMSVKITDDMPGSDLWNMFEGILYAAKMGARVINCSWGELGHMRSEQELLDVVEGTYDAIVVGAAGNDGNESITYPASYDGVLSVAAVRNGDTRAFFSNYNYRVDLSAPGMYIYAPSANGGYAYGDGTSHAAAVASGCAALLRAKFPSLRASQIVGLLRATTDDIASTLGSYADRMGTGRINLYSAMLEGTGMISARAVSLAFDDEDGVVSPGETVSLRVGIRNELAAASAVHLSVTTATPAIQIAGGEMDLGPMASDQLMTSASGAITMTVPSDVQPDTRVVLKIVVTTASRSNVLYVPILVYPTFRTTSINSITGTFNSVGNIGYNGTNRTQGDGFRLGKGKDLLYHAGLMVGTSADRLADVVRTGSMSAGTADGLHMILPYRLSTSADGRTQIGRAAFSDRHLPADARVGVSVDMTTYERTDSAWRDLVLVVYRIHNDGTAPLIGLHGGLYLDWDIGEGGDDDTAGYDAARGYGWVSNKLFPGLTAAAAVVSPQTVDFSVFANGDEGVGTDFTAARKFRLLSNGILNGSAGPDELGMVIGGGPMTIEPGTSAELAIVLGASENPDGLHDLAERGRALYSDISGVAAPDAPSFELASNVSPNPFNSETEISFRLERAANVSVTIVNARGLTMAQPLEARLDAGRHVVRLDAGTLPNGVYFYEIRAGALVSRGKLVRIAR